jgi:hypothetical protein
MEQTIDAWLGVRGFSQYSEIFKENDIDVRVLPHLTNDDLRELGVSLGHRKIILAAIADAQQGDLAREISPPASETISDPIRNNGPDAVTLAYAERRNITVLFADLVGFTEKTNRIDP